MSSDGYARLAEAYARIAAQRVASEPAAAVIDDSGIRRIPKAFRKDGGRAAEGLEDGCEQGAEMVAAALAPPPIPAEMATLQRSVQGSLVNRAVMPKVSRHDLGPANPRRRNQEDGRANMGWQRGADEECSLEALIHRRGGGIPPLQEAASEEGALDAAISRVSRWPVHYPQTEERDERGFLSKLARGIRKGR